MYQLQNHTTRLGYKIKKSLVKWRISVSRSTSYCEVWITHKQNVTVSQIKWNYGMFKEIMVPNNETIFSTVHIHTICWRNVHSMYVYIVLSLCRYLTMTNVIYRFATFKKLRYLCRTMKSAHQHFVRPLLWQYYLWDR